MIIWASLLAMSCIDAQNPFKDMSRAAVVVHERSEIQDKDIIKKDKLYTVYFAILLKEHIDSFSVQMSSYVLLKDTTVEVTKTIMNPFPLAVLFSDTGVITFSIITYLTDTSIKTETMIVKNE